MLAAVLLLPLRGCQWVGKFFSWKDGKSEQRIMIEQFNKRGKYPARPLQRHSNDCPCNSFSLGFTPHGKGAQKIPNNWIKQRVQIHARYLNRVFYEAKQQHKKGFCFLLPALGASPTEVGKFIQYDWGPSLDTIWFDSLKLLSVHFFESNIERRRQQEKGKNINFHFYNTESYIAWIFNSTLSRTEGVLTKGFNFLVVSHWKFLTFPSSGPRFNVFMNVDSSLCSMIWMEIIAEFVFELN